MMEKPMSILKLLASSLRRKDEAPNIELAQLIVDQGHNEGVKELVEQLQGPDKNIASDCIKVLYEVGERKPGLIAPYINEFLALLKSKNNRLQWGAMTALDAITLEGPELMYGHLSEIMKCSDNGSVITKDHGINILIKLCSIETYHDECFQLLLEQLMDCPENQLPSYSEKSMHLIKDNNELGKFVTTLQNRMGEVIKESKRRRLERVVKKVCK